MNLADCYFAFYDDSAMNEDGSVAIAVVPQRLWDKEQCWDDESLATSAMEKLGFYQQMESVFEAPEGMSPEDARDILLALGCVENVEILGDEETCPPYTFKRPPRTPTKRIKLSSDAICNLLALKAEAYAPDRSDIHPQEANPLSPYGWKREGKAKLGNLHKSTGGYLKTVFGRCSDMQECMDHFADDPIVLDPQPLTGDCVARVFSCHDACIDTLVVSDPKDERVLQILWSCD